ncbi:MAG: InlB B-repeat-containing protein [Treponema sp.]|nr:InlB B-repeat-containing protein [Treponema sp.]
MKIKALYILVTVIVLMLGCGSNPRITASDDLDLTLRQVSDYLNERIPTGRKIAVISIQSGSSALSEYIIDELISNAVNDNRYSVVDRQQLDVARDELNLNLSGEISDNSAQSVGQFLGVQIIVTGRVSQIGDNYRISIRALEVETVQVQGSNNWNISSGKTITALMNTRTGINSTSPTTTARTQPTTSASTNTPVRYTVTFNANGASGTAPTAQTVQNGESITIPDVGTMTNSSSNFGGWNTRADGGGTSYTAGSVFTVNANTQLYARWIEHVYRIGDRGPAGGLIFYDKGNNSSGWRYLEAAPVDIGSKLHPASERIAPSTDRSVGTGMANTQAIMREANNRGGGFGWAAQACDALVINSFDDWFLPSRDELNHMYGNLHMRGLGSFRSEGYWTSTAGGTDLWNDRIWWWVDFSNGNNQTQSYGDLQKHVRAIRQF